MPTTQINNLNELLGQTPAAFKKESNRLASFSAYNGSPSAIILARNGFIYKHNSKEVECICCHNTVPVVNLRQTSVLHSVNVLHHPNCQWDTPQHNEPSYSRTNVDLRNERALEYIRIRAGQIHAEEVNSSLPQEHGCSHINEERVDSFIYSEPRSLDMAPVGECPCGECARPGTQICWLVMEGNHLTATRTGYAELARMEQTRMNQHDRQRPDYSNVESRVDTFGNMRGWPNQSALQSPRHLAEAGFFYTGPEDNVQCFQCVGGLRNWDSHSDPWREHARWFPWCEHVRREMGDRFIHKVLKTTKKIRKSHEDREQTIRTDVVENALMRGHTTEDISREIQKFFKETGYYPGYEVLIERLEVQE